MNIWIFYELILYMNRANFPMILNKREWRHRFRSFECIQGSFEIVRNDEKKRICYRIRCLGETVFLVYAKKKTNKNHFKILRHKSWIWVVKMKILSKHSNHDASELKEISLNFERMILRVRCKMDAIVRLPMDFRARLSNTFKYL